MTVMDFRQYKLCPTLLGLNLYNDLYTKISRQSLQNQNTVTKFTKHKARMEIKTLELPQVFPSDYKSLNLLIFTSI